MAHVRCTVLLLFGLVSQVLCDASAGSSATLKITKAAAKLVKADGSSSSYDGSYPQSFLDSVELKPAESLEASLSVTKDGQAFKPQQVFLKLTSKSHNAAAFFVAKNRKESYVASVTVSGVEKQLGKLGGEFTAAWLLGDLTVSKGVIYEIGSIEIDQPKEAPKLPLTASTQPHTFAKEEIIHQHRAPEKRAPASVSMVFTGLAVAPLAGLLLSISSLRVNFKGFPSGSSGLAALAFHAGIAGMLGLYVLFWLKLNLVETLPLAILGGIFVAFTGYKALSAVADNRLKKD